MTVSICNGIAAVNAGYTAIADPVSTSTGTRYFGTDNRGTIFQHTATLGPVTGAVNAAGVPIQ